MSALPSPRTVVHSHQDHFPLQVIVGYPPTRILTPEEKDLLWKYRFYLCREKNALTKFLKSASWDEGTEEKSLIELLDKWANIDVDDALELLSPAFHNKIIRSYAVKQLEKADDAVGASIPLFFYFVISLFLFLTLNFLLFLC